MKKFFLLPVVPQQDRKGHTKMGNQIVGRAKHPLAKHFAHSFEKIILYLLQSAHTQLYLRRQTQTCNNVELFSVNSLNILDDMIT